jgi:hypothetical protein
VRRAVGNRFISLPRGDLAKAICNTIADGVEVTFGDSITELHENQECIEVLFQRSQLRRFDLVAGLRRAALRGSAGGLGPKR